MDFLELIEKGKTINSKLISLPRLEILSALLPLDMDGALYRDLKASLKMNDGILYSNLKALQRMQYITKKEIQFENKKMDVFIITKEGKEAIHKVKNWLKEWIKLLGD